MNLLSKETSPYLLQHAQNPVHWQAWRPETLEKARLEQRPILVSIGYSTCHWCHVMERESFENEATAELMNRLFVCIKIDREERPDLDQIYMEACQILTGSGGWPLNVFLLPDGRPFFAGTYWPPRPAFNRPAWRQVLEHIGSIWAEKREIAEEQAAKLMAAIERNDRVFLKKPLPNPPQKGGLFDSEEVKSSLSNSKNNEKAVPFGEGLGGASPLFNPVLLDAIFWQMSQNFDREAGGFGSAPKFPSTMSIAFLLQFGYVFGKSEALEHAFFSLEKMARGGIYDLLGGGFSRYATDADWLVPHFEKMLYDNALLLSALADGLKWFKKVPFSTENEARARLFERTIRETCGWLEREMTAADGSFFSAQDADSEGEEGRFFVWRSEEIFEILGETDGQLFADFHGAVGGEGNWEHGQNILHRPFSAASFCQKAEIDEAIFEGKMARARSILFEKRSARVWPGRDEKRLLGWNALMVSGLAKAFEATGDGRLKSSAAKNLAFLFEKMVGADGRFFHVFTAEKAEIEAFLEDLACLAAACVDFYEIDFDPKWLARGVEIVDRTNRDFWDAETSTFFFASKNQADLVTRRRDLYDNATPSGNSTMASVLQRLGLHLGREDWREQARAMLAAMRETVERFPLSFERWASAMLFEAVGAREIAVVGRGSEAMAREIGQLFLPARVLAASETGDEKLPLLASKNVEAGAAALIFLCENEACRAPVATVEELVAML